MKKVLSLCFLICFFLSLWAEPIQEKSSGFYFKLATGADVRCGIVTENFYNTSYLDSLYKVSWLTWETLPSTSLVFDAMFGYEFNAHNSINLDGFFSYAIPYKTGIMQDYDAREYDNRVTDYSCHDNYTDQLISAGFYSDWCFFYGLGLGIGFEYNNIKFRGQNGYAQHYYNRSPGYWSPDLPHTSEYDGYTVITYDITSFYWKPGIVWHCTFDNGISLSLDIWNYLYRFNHAQDIHYVYFPVNRPDTYYTDFIEAWFQGYEARAALEFNFTENLSFLIRIKGTYLPDAIGDDY
nr:hypothetical protein [Treponemataceae bacterium]